MKNFFSNTLKRREKEAGTDRPAEAPKPAPADGTQPTQSNFFYDSPSELRKKRQPK